MNPPPRRTWKDTLREHWDDVCWQPTVGVGFVIFLGFALALAWALWQMSPLWLLWVAAMVLAIVGVPVETLIIWRENDIERLRREHVCLTCGYDCRATPKRCPECGSPPGKLPGSLGPPPPGTA